MLRRSPAVALVLAATLLTSCGGGGGGSGGSTERPDLVVNGQVWAIAVAPDGTAYLGGDFTAVGPFTGHVVVLDPVSGALAAPAPRFAGNHRTTGWVSAAAPDGAGGWYVGGSFTPGPGAAEAALVRVRADGTIDPAFATSFDDSVDALAVRGGTVYVGGRFDHAGGAARRRLAAVDAATGALTAWDPMQSPTAIAGLAPSNTLATVDALAVRDGVIYAGGLSIAGRTWSGWLAAMDPDGAVSTWSPAVAGGRVAALAVHGGSLVVGGSFTAAGGQPRTGLAAFDPDGALSTWTVTAAGVQALAVVDGTLYAGGTFTSVGGVSHRGIVAFDPSGAPSTWDPNLEGAARALAASGGTLYVGGSFERAGGARRMNLAAFDASGALLPWNPAANDDVDALAASGGGILAGGTLTSVGAVRRSRLAALDASGRLSAWDPDVDDRVGAPSVRALAVDGERIYVGGAFAAIRGAARANLAAVDRHGNLLDATPGVDGPVHALATFGGAVYAGGSFSTVGRLRRDALAAFDPEAAGSVLGFDPALAGTWGWEPAVHALAPRGSVLYVGGQLGGARGAARGHGAAFDAAGTLLPWDPRASLTGGGAIHALAPGDDGIHVGGNFSSLGGQERRGIGRVDAVSGAPTGWSPAPASPTSQSIVSAILLAGQTVYVGGNFADLGGPENVCVAALDRATGVATGWNPQALAWVHALGASGGRILFGDVAGVSAVAP